jgi:hypothetical protein
MGLKMFAYLSRLPPASMAVCLPSDRIVGLDCLNNWMVISKRESLPCASSGISSHCQARTQEAPMVAKAFVYCIAFLVPLAGVASGIFAAAGVVACIWGSGVLDK